MDDQTIDTRRRPDEENTSRQDDSPPPKSSRLKRLIGFSVVGLVLLGLIVGGTRYWLNARNFESTDDAFIDAYTTQMAPRVAGQVAKLLFSDNQHVDAGQTLLLLDPSDYQARLDQARAQQTSAEASLQQAHAQVSVQQANLDQARANVTVAESDLLQAREDNDRYHAIDPKAVTRQQIDQVTATFRSAKAKLEASRQSVGAAQAQVHAAEAQVLAAEASVKQAQASTRTAELQLSYCTMVAPVAGTITHRTVDAGNYVNPGQALFALVQDERWVTANFKETQLSRIRPGQAVDLSIDAVPSVTFRGKVDSFQSGTGSAFSVLPAENATGNFVKIVQRLPVKILFDDDRVKKFPLAPGMSVVPEVRVR
jgi:membrane fusion protein (multidrug efflux system)